MGFQVADYSMTISNSINLFGAAVPNDWSAFTWGNFLWGEGNQDLGIVFEKWIDNNTSIDSSWEIGLTIQVSISNSITLDSDRDNAYLYDGNGYLYVDAGPVTDLDDELANIFSESSRPANAFTKQTRPTTSWS